MTLSVLEKDCAIGCFTHRNTYIGYLQESAKKFLPEIPFITVINNAEIADNMSLLRDKFIETGKRFVVYMDDDIMFLNSTIIKDAIETLVKYKAGICTVYSTFDVGSLNAPYDAKGKGLVERYHNYAVGYFILCDQEKVGHILPDKSLPFKNTAVDASFSVAARADGWSIVISPNYVYHLWKNTKANMEQIEPTNAYLMNKYGRFYFDYSQYGGCCIEWGLGAGNAV